MTTITAAAAAKFKQKEVPSYLVAEVIDGKPYYYRGYKKVLSGKLKLEDIMGASSLQGIIVGHLMRLLAVLDEFEFYILLNETGIHLNTNNNLSGDILIFNTQKPFVVDTHYVSRAPDINIEIDVNIDLEKVDEKEYIFKKTQALLNFGTEKVIWILTKTGKVIVATPNENWQIINWTKDIEILRGIVFNIPTYLDKLRANGTVVNI